MQYYKNENTGEVFGFDETDPTQLPYIEKAIDDGCVYIGNSPPPPPAISADENKATAVSLLQATDWTQIPSVSDPALSNPYLANKMAFDQYRNSVRQIAIYPVAGDIDWAIAPQEVWQSI